MIRCSYCDGEFEPRTPHQHYCCTDCRYSGHKVARRTSSIIKVRLSRDEYMALERLAQECETTLAEIATEMVRESMARCAA